MGSKPRQSGIVFERKVLSHQESAYIGLHKGIDSRVPSKENECQHTSLLPTYVLSVMLIDGEKNNQGYVAGLL